MTKSSASSRKRKRNPLASARGKQQLAENVWFRKSGAGYSLFMEYYAKQPVGTVSDGGSPVHPGISDSNTSNLTSSGKLKPLTGTKGGMSRASKRRKRKASTSERSPNSSQPAATRVSVDPSSPQKDKSTSTICANMVSLVQTQSASRLQTSRLLSLLASHPESNKFETISGFLETMSTGLPLTFRIRATVDPLAREKLERKLESTAPYPVISSYTVSTVNSKPDKNIQHNSIFQGTFTKAELSSHYPKVKEVLLEHSADGTLARQELGSMLPVLALTQLGFLQPGSRCLDMCSSPGSKTMQALEVVGRKGRIIANDILQSRLDSLRQAIERSGIPESLIKRIKYSCEDATVLTLSSSSSSSSSTTTKSPDVILCDVPCSGDGTARKDKHILPMWKPDHGNYLHKTQLGILFRAVHLVKPGGAICYSTCSLNPVEDEAVVAAILKKCNPPGKKPLLELVEWKLPTEVPVPLVLRPGICSWKVADWNEDKNAQVDTAANDNNDFIESETPRLCWYETYQDAVRSGMEGACESMWPPSTSKTDNTVEEVLSKCLRLWPQDQNTGGFFLAILRKLE